MSPVVSGPSAVHSATVSHCGSIRSSSASGYTRSTPVPASRGGPVGREDASAEPRRAMRDLAPDPAIADDPEVEPRTSPCGAPLSTQLVRHEPRSRNSPEISAKP